MWGVVVFFNVSRTQSCSTLMSYVHLNFAVCLDYDSKYRVSHILRLDYGSDIDLSGRFLVDEPWYEVLYEHNSKF